MGNIIPFFDFEILRFGDLGIFRPIRHVNSFTDQWAICHADIPISAYDQPPQR
jgi:hypothetical protein